jgi:hypothetical protein
MPKYESGLIRVDMFQNGVPVGGGPLVTLQNLSVTNTLDKMGEYSFPVPSTDPRTASIGIGTNYKFYHKKFGFLGEGLHRETRITPGDEPITEVFADFLTKELTYEWVSFNRQYENQYLGTIATDLISLVPGWSAGTIENVGFTTLEFQGESVLNAIVQLAKNASTHFRMPNLSQRKLDFGDFGNASGVRCINVNEANKKLETTQNTAIIERLTILEEGDIINYLVPVASGQGESQITLEWVTTTDPSYPVLTGINPDGSNFYYIEDTTSQTTYNRTVKKVYRRNDIRPLSNDTVDLNNAANALYNAAVSFLKKNKDPATSYRLSINYINAPFNVGDTVRVIYRGLSYHDSNGFLATYKYVDVDAELVVLSATADFRDNGQVRMNLEVSSNGIQPVSDASFVADMNRDIDIVRGNVQPSASTNTVSSLNQVEPGRDMEIPIRIKEHVLLLNEAILRFDTRPLRATVLGAVSDDHDHTSLVFNRVDPATLGVNDKEVFIHQNDGDVKFPSLDPGPSTIAKTSSAYGHSHDPIYGIFDDAHYPQNIRVWFNGVDISVPLGGPWAATDSPVDIDDLNITEYFKDGGGNLIKQVHQLKFTVEGGLVGENKGSIFAEVDMLQTIQPIIT